MSAPAAAWTSACSTRIDDRVVVDDVAGLVDDTVVAVRRVGIERDVGEHADLRRRVLDRLDRAADEVVGIERFLGALGAQVLGRVGEQSDARNAERGGLLGLARRYGRCSNG